MTADDILNFLERSGKTTISIDKGVCTVGIHLADKPIFAYTYIRKPTLKEALREASSLLST